MGYSAITLPLKDSLEIVFMIIKIIKIKNILIGNEIFEFFFFEIFFIAFFKKRERELKIKNKSNHKIDG